MGILFAVMSFVGAALSGERMMSSNAYGSVGGTLVWVCITAVFVLMGVGFLFS